MCDMTQIERLFSCVTWLVICVIWPRQRETLSPRMAWLNYTCDTTHLCVCQFSSIRVAWPIQVCDMLHSRVWLAPPTRVTRLIRTSHASRPYLWQSRVWHDAFIFATCLVLSCGMTHSCVGHTSLPKFTCMCKWVSLIFLYRDFSSICAPCLIHIHTLAYNKWERMKHVFNHSYEAWVKMWLIDMCVICDSLICLSSDDMTRSRVWFVHVCDEALSYLWRDSCISVAQCDMFVGIRL